jgi:hypothetical protein
LLLPRFLALGGTDYSANAPDMQIAGRTGAGHAARHAKETKAAADRLLDNREITPTEHSHRHRIFVLEGSLVLRARKIISKHIRANAFEFFAKCRLANIGRQL